MLVASMNPCPCGYFTDPKKECHCTPIQIQRYLSKISGPLLDRIDVHLEVPSLSYNELSCVKKGEDSSEIKKRIQSAIKIQSRRYNSTKIKFNALLGHKDIEKFCNISEESCELLKSAVLELGLSARGYDKILKLSRTIADLDAKEDIQPEHISEAIGYRVLDRNLWTF
jgi:magnesium chelatase family protein